MLAVFGVCLAILLSFDWNRAKPWLNDRIREATGRPIVIQGDLSLRWDRAAPAESGWRGWIPWPHLLAQNIKIGNPEWSRESNMGEIRQLAMSLNPVSLLSKKIKVPVLQFEAPSLTLERSADGRNNWTFSPQKPSAWQVEIDQVVLNKATVHFVDVIKHADVKLAINTLDDARPNGYGVRWTLTGVFNGERVSGSGKAGAVLSLHAQTRPYPIEASVHIGKTTIHAKGTMTKPSDLAALDMRLQLSGASMAQLYPLTGLVLPETSPYSTEGHLSASFGRRSGNWIYEKFSGKMGASDLAGTLEYESKQPRPLLKGSVISSVLQLEDLAPLVGADSNDRKAQRGVNRMQPPGKVLPVEEFKSERWTSIDAEVKFTGRKIARSGKLPIENLITDIHLRDGVLSMMPLDFGIAGGNVSSKLKLDGHDKIIKAEIQISARHLKLKQLLPALQTVQASFGEINGDAKLSATGNSIAAMLGSSNGEIKALINQGTISKLLLEEIGLDIGSIVLTRIVGDKQVHLNCMAGDFTASSGVLQARSVVLDTDDGVLHIAGHINLAQEQLDLIINARSKGLRVISLRAPLYLTGSFSNPKVAVDQGVVVRKAGSAIALAVLAPFAALIPLINVGPGETSECAALVADAHVKPVAPAPGKIMGSATTK